MTPRKAVRPWPAQPVSRVSAPVPVSFPVHQCAGEANDWIQSAAWLMRGPSDPGQAINHVIRTNVPRKKQNTPSAHGIHCIHLHLCMHAVKACQGHRDGEQSSSPLQITLQRQEMREVCVCMHLCVCWQAGVGGCFSENPLSADTLYVDCLHRRQCLKVKVILMNSNGSTDCLRQAIHNHSSFLLSLFFCPHSFFVFPVTGSSVSRNNKSCIIFFPSSVMTLNHFQ